ncbi:MAG: peptidoglycan DD-metalloendopeptidase family protein [Symploca sp. SIO2E9]|nr:peptidoglycan DD-metalloendopeptidase family protein [Symploca sp. SIO2E9]
MKTESSSAGTPLGIFYRCPRLMQALSFIGSCGVLSSGIVVAQTSLPVDQLVPPNAPTVKPLAKKVPAPAPAAKPKPTVPESLIVPATPVRKPASPPAAARKPTPARTPAASLPTHGPAQRKPNSFRPPASSASAPTPPTTVNKKPALSPPNLSVPPTQTIAKPPKVPLKPAPNQQTAGTTFSGNHNFIDRTNYSVGATGQYNAPNSVVLNERSTGCNTVSHNGVLASGVCNTKAPTPTVSSRRRVRPSQQVAVRRRSKRLPAKRLSRTTRRAASSTPIPVKVASRVLRSTMPQKPVTYELKPTELSYYNFTKRPSRATSLEQESFLYPLVIPATISSRFGWRLHPISKTHKFHNGTDLAVPEGTPVIASASGRVATADFLRGYGLTVILRHEEETQESLYGHLSEIFVEPDEWVAQGTVIGRAGNTGNSTGPHLHFEWRHLTDDGWMAVDAGAHLEYSMAQFIDALKLVQTDSPADTETSG